MKWSKLVANLVGQRDERDPRHGPGGDLRRRAVVRRRATPAPRGPCGDDRPGRAAGGPPGRRRPTPAVRRPAAGVPRPARARAGDRRRAGRQVAVAPAPRPGRPEGRPPTRAHRGHVAQRRGRARGGGAWASRRPSTPGSRRWSRRSRRTPRGRPGSRHAPTGSARRSTDPPEPQPPPPPSLPRSFPRLKLPVALASRSSASSGSAVASAAARRSALAPPTVTTWRPWKRHEHAAVLRHAIAELVIRHEGLPATLTALVPAAQIGFRSHSEWVRPGRAAVRSCQADPERG